MDLRTAGYHAKTDQDLWTQPQSPGATGRYLGARLLREELLAKRRLQPAEGDASYKRDYLMPRLKSDGGLEPKPACYADAMVATAGLLGILGLPLELQGYWTEHSERSVLPTALSLMDVPPQDKDLLGRWKPEGSDVYARSFGGRLQALFAGAAREADRYTRLDEREIAADLVPWLMERPKLSRDQAELTVEGLRRRWRGSGA